MILSRRAALGGIQMDELHEAIVIRGIDPGTPQRTLTGVSRMSGAGQRVTEDRWETLEAKITWAIDIPKRQMAARRRIYEMVTAWAGRCGWLTLSGMEGRRLFVDKVILSGHQDLWEWTEEYEITLRAYNVPFWQSDLPSQASGQMSAGRVWLNVEGDVESPVDVSFQNVSGATIQNISVSAGGKTIALTGIALGGTETLTITHGEDGLLRIMAGSRSVYSKYTGADDLIVIPGRVAVDVSSQRAGILTATNWGRWL
jgi:hypothetical protein